MNVCNFIAGESLKAALFDHVPATVGMWKTNRKDRHTGKVLMLQTMASQSWRLFTAKRRQIDTYRITVIGTANERNYDNRFHAQWSIIRLSF